MRWHTGAQTEIVAGEMQTNINLSVLAGGCLPVWCLLSLFQDPSCSSKIRTHTHKIKSCLMWHRMPGILCILFFFNSRPKKALGLGDGGFFFFFFLNKSFIFFFYYSVWLKAMCSHCEQREMGRQRGGGEWEREHRQVEKQAENFKANETAATEF